MLSNVHVSDSKNYLNENIKSFLFGFYRSFCMINLYYANYQLRLVSRLIMRFTFYRQNIYFLKSTGFGPFKNKWFNIQISNFLIYDFDWIGGFFTNFKYVRRYFTLRESFEKKEINKLIGLDLLLKEQKLRLLSLFFLPSLIVFFDNYNYDALKEASYLGIPTIGIVDINSIHLNILNYAIVGNNKAYSSLFLYYNLFYNSILKGLHKEYLKLSILHETK